MPKTTMIKNDALVTLNFGSAFIEHLQKVTLWIANERTPEELENYKNMVTNNETLEESWMTSFYTMSSLINAIEKNAIDNGHTYDTEINEQES